MINFNKALTTFICQLLNWLRISDSISLLRCTVENKTHFDNSKPMTQWNWIEKNLRLDCTPWKFSQRHENALYNRYSKKEQHRCLCCQRTILLEINNKIHYFNLKLYTSSIRFKFNWSYMRILLFRFGILRHRLKRQSTKRSRRIVGLMMSQNIIFRRRLASLLYKVYADRTADTIRFYGAGSESSCLHVYVSRCDASDDCLTIDTSAWYKTVIE